MTQHAQTPILVTGFNRPNQLEDCLRTLLQNGIENIYLAIDGPRTSHAADIDAVHATRAVAERILPEFRKAETFFSALNNGCYKGVSNAITWAFESSNRLIIVEDDIAVSRKFIQFVELSLAQFASDQSIGSISGSNLVPSRELSHPENFARRSIFTHSWGWATWADRWHAFQLADEANKLQTKTNFPEPARSLHARIYWHGIFADTLKGKINSWAYRWLLFHWQSGWSAVTPNTNLTLNTGFDSEATHTTGSSPSWLPRDTDLESSSAFELGQQLNLLTDENADRWLQKNVHQADPAHLWALRLKRPLTSRPRSISHVHPI